MDRVVGFLRGVYNFFVGDPVLLTGTVAFFILIGLLAKTKLSASPIVLGLVLVVGILATLALSLWRETQPKHP